jgi:hypothetical protein
VRITSITRPEWESTGDVAAVQQLAAQGLWNREVAQMATAPVTAEIVPAVLAFDQPAVRFLGLEAGVR